MFHKNKIIHFHPNGKYALSFVKPLVDAERAAGYNSTIVTSTNSDYVEATEIPFDLNFKNFFLPCAFFSIYLLIKREKPNIIISHNSKSSTIVLVTSWLAGVPVRIYFNHGVPYVTYFGLVKHLLRSLEKINLIFSTSVLSVSIDMLALLKELDIHKSIAIINNGSACGIDCSLYGKQLYLDSNFRFDNNIAKEDLVTLFIGRPERRKGFKLILELWIGYFYSDKYKLVLCGASKSDVVNAVGFLPGNVIALGFSKQVPEVLSKSDILILPSYHEGLSYAILEAMASGCIVVANNILGVRKLIVNEFNGFLVQDNDIKGYADIIKKIQSLPRNTLNDIRLNGLDSVKNFSREHFLVTYLEYLQKNFIRN